MEKETRVPNRKDRRSYLQSYSHNNRKEINKRGKNPRGMLVQRIPKQVTAVGKDRDGNKVALKFKTLGYLKVYHLRNRVNA